ncbi:MAG: glycosyltransferase family 2 protein [Clostridia bacterium]|nr:glycosyltransferase family 2 protein [Clostridia bacterium]
MERLAIVVPCYNEEEVFENTAERLTERLSALVQKNKISPDSYILFVDDGSTDNTWQLMMAEYKKNYRVQVLGLAGNAGQQNALLAGFACVVNQCEIAVSLDADLQDDLGVLEKMIDKRHQGADVVYGVRNDRRSDTVFKRVSAHMFYLLMKMLGTKTVSHHAEYRLMSSEVLRELMRYDERNIFVRGIIPLMGFRSEVVYYARKHRTAGRSKYSLGKMISTAFEAITSFSIRPLSMIMLMGAAIALCALVGLVVLIVCTVCGMPISEGKYILASVWLLGGMQLTATGVVGEYAGRTYFETKRRPRYRVRQLLRHDEDSRDSYKIQEADTNGRQP